MNIPLRTFATTGQLILIWPDYEVIIRNTGNKDYPNYNLVSEKGTTHLGGNGETILASLFGSIFTDWRDGK